MLSDALGEEADVVLIDQAEGFVFGFSKLDVMFGRTSAGHVLHRYADIDKPGLRFVQARIESLDPTARRVVSEGGHEFYTVAGALSLRDVLASFDAGRVVIGVTSTPFKCPPAPSETALMTHDFLIAQGLADRSEPDRGTRRPLDRAGRGQDCLPLRPGQPLVREELGHRPLVRATVERRSDEGACAEEICGRADRWSVGRGHFDPSNQPARSGTQVARLLRPNHGTSAICGRGRGVAGDPRRRTSECRTRGVRRVRDRRSACSRRGWSRCAPDRSPVGFRQLLPRWPPVGNRRA